MITVDIETIKAMPQADKVDLVEVIEQIIMDYRDHKRPLDFTLEAIMEAYEVAPALSASGADHTYGADHKGGCDAY